MREKDRIGTPRRHRGLPAARTVVALSIWLTVGVMAEMRTFKSSDGREINAEIQYGSADTVTIKLEGGKIITSPISKFSDEDQEYIRRWIVTKPAKVNYSFAVKYDKTRLGSKNRNTKSTKVTEESWAYKLTFENRTRIDLEGIELRYRIFVSSEHQKQKNQKAIYMSDGVKRIPAIKKSSSVQLVTKGVPLLTSDLKDGYVYNDGRRHRLSDEMAGIWIKVFHRGQRVWEFQSPHKAVRDSSFTDDAARAIGKKKG